MEAAAALPERRHLEPADRRNRHPGQQEEQRRPQPATIIASLNAALVRSAGAVQLSNRCASIMSSTATPRIQSR